jgi:hypothetical protein
MKHLFKLFTVLSLALVIGASTGTSAFAAATVDCTGGGGTDVTAPNDAGGGQIKCNNVDTNTIVSKIYSFAAIISGIVLGIGVLVIVYAGFKYATSQGDPKVTEQAKMQIISAGVGIGIAMLAFVILNIFKTVVG